MASDRARISYDKNRYYRSVVAQQGRVTLEADVNEAAWIASDAMRLETIDVVGPAGTPDNGYQVKVSADGTQFVVGEGTMYLGGWRMHLSRSAQLDKQPDWLNQPSPSQIPVAATTTNMVALLAIEQSVTAVEDQALREVALGGPDTAARIRLMQHFVEVPVSATTCMTAAKQVEAVLAGNGLYVDSKTLDLQVDASLQVSFNPPLQPVDPCCPPAQGGYLGADNQLVRVTVTGYDPGTKTGTLLWGWNNASFLYRAALVDAAAKPQILTLSPAPIDTYHMPQPNQAIEVLRTQCILGDPSNENYVAALQGQVMTLSTGSVFANNQLTLPQTLDAPYSSDKNPLFVRLWQSAIPFTEGQATALDKSSGLAVTIHIKKMPTAPFDARPYWHFAVRPNTPQQIYPRRYLDESQPPDGPRQWLCDLAVVQTAPGQPSSPTLTVLENCTIPFEPLTKQDSCGCCELTLHTAEDWQTKLKAVLNDPALTNLSICLQPGTFEVTNKIVFTQASVKIRGAGVGTVLQGKTLEAVLEFDKCGAVNLSDFGVAAGTAGYSPKQGTQNLLGAVTLRDCLQVDIERLALKCTDADFRMASCLYVINTAAAGGATPLPLNNLRIINCEFVVGHCQVGVLLVNANIARVEGNWIFTPDSLRNIKSTNIAQYPHTMARLQKLMLNGLTLVDSTAGTKKAARKLVKYQTKLALKTPQKEKTAGAEPTGVQEIQPAVAAPADEKAKVLDFATESSTVKPTTKTDDSAVDSPSSAVKINLGLGGRSRITQTFGTIEMQFTSSSKLTNPWTKALKASSLSTSSKIRQIHDTVKNIAKLAILEKSPEKGLNDYVSLLLPSLYSISSQGIVVAGQYANDIRILNNTIEGTMQGIHIGLSDAKANPQVSHLQANLVQIANNTIALRLTPEANFDRHGIYVGGVMSAWISNNNVSVVRKTEENSMPITAIRVVGLLGPRVLIEGNFVNNFLNNYDTGIETTPAHAGPPAVYIWKASNNVSTAGNTLNGFSGVDNSRP